MAAGHLIIDGAWRHKRIFEQALLALTEQGRFYSNQFYDNPGFPRNEVFAD
jgi:hypothetical protein